MVERTDKILVGTMKSQQEVEIMLNEIKQNDLCNRPFANPTTNSIVFGMQCILEAKMNTLEQVLGLPLSKIPLTK